MSDQQHPDDELADRLDFVPVGIDTGTDRWDWFRRKVVREAVKMVASNLQSPYADPKPDDHREYAREHAMNPDNVREVQVRDRDLGDVRATFWLKDCPPWANDAQTRKLISLETRDDCHVVVDVRPF